MAWYLFQSYDLSEYHLRRQSAQFAQSLLAAVGLVAIVAAVDVVASAAVVVVVVAVALVVVAVVADAVVELHNIDSVLETVNIDIGRMVAEIVDDHMVELDAVLHSLDSFV